MRSMAEVERELRLTTIVDEEYAGAVILDLLVCQTLISLASLLYSK